jgi:hypothetical protein
MRRHPSRVLLAATLIVLTLLEERRAAFDFPSMMTAVLALLVLSLAVDFISAAARRSWR